MNRSPQTALPANPSPRDAALVEAAQRYFVDPSPARLLALASPNPEPVPQEMRRATLLIQGAHAAIDEEVRVISEKLAEGGQPVVCRGGCDACCKQAILAYPFEAALIGTHLQQRPDKLALFEEGYARWDRQTRHMRDDFMAWARRSYREQRDDGSFRFTDFREPCPFLANELCQIYPVRPYACRGYLALSQSCPRPVDPAHRPGFQGMDVGAYTAFQKSRKPFLELLWRRFGIEPDQTRDRLLPDLVRVFLDQGAAGLLDACLSGPLPGAAAADLAA